MACLMVDEVITLVDLEEGKSYQVGPDNANYTKIRKLLGRDNNAAKLRELLDIPKAITRFSDGAITVTDNQVSYNGEPVHNTITNRILGFMAEGLPFEPLVQFLGKLMENPSFRAREELYDFLENKNLPLTDDGCFLAYKAIRSDFKDKFSGTVDNSIGRMVVMDRGAVDDNREQGCSKGLHCGALDYVKSYGNGSTDRVVIVKVNPADVVSVPSDCAYQKLRTCRYEVMKEFVGELAKSLYNSTANDYEYNLLGDQYQYGCGGDDDYGDDGSWIDDDDDSEDDYWTRGDVRSY
jgi:hypothetical protein